MTETYLTPEGYKTLQEKLNHLKSVVRVEVSKRIGIARDFGDLSENAEYDAAKEEQAQVEAEIEEIEEKLRVAKIINKKNIKTDAVSIGSKVKVRDLDYKEDFEYRIVGSTESDPMNGLISNGSPVGKALLNKKVGDTAEAVLDTGAIIKLKVLKKEA